MQIFGLQTSLARSADYSSVRRRANQPSAGQLAKLLARDDNCSCKSGRLSSDATKIGEDIMLTRRGFVGFVSCAVCAATGFAATEASAQGTPAATTPGVTRKILSQVDGPTPGYVTISVEAEI